MSWTSKDTLCREYVVDESGYPERFPQQPKRILTVKEPDTNTSSAKGTGTNTSFRNGTGVNRQDRQKENR